MQVGNNYFKPDMKEQHEYIFLYAINTFSSSISNIGDQLFYNQTSSYAVHSPNYIMLL